MFPGDFTTLGSRMTKGGKQQLIRDGRSAARISNKLRSQDRSGGVVLTTACTKTPAWTLPTSGGHSRPPVDP